MLKLKGGPNGQSLTLQPTEIVEIEGDVWDSTQLAKGYLQARKLG